MLRTRKTENSIPTAGEYLLGHYRKGPRYGNAEPVWSSRAAEGCGTMPGCPSQVSRRQTPNPSGTRSRTLFGFMFIPINPCTGGQAFVFGKEKVNSLGPASSFLSRSADHEEEIPVIVWQDTACPKCRNGRHHTASIIHDFALEPDPTAMAQCGRQEHYEYTWKGVWPPMNTKRSNRTSTA